MKQEDGLHYFVEALPGKRGQMHADLVTDGKVEATWPVGSPAPLAVVEAACEEDNRRVRHEP